MFKLNKKLPDVTGVYLFKKIGEVLYVGKATSLRDRVRSYFNKNVVIDRGPGIEKMVELASSIDFVKTDSVLEALILEANLIKKYQPRFNIKEKDDKSFLYIVITNEDFPRVLVVRQNRLIFDKNDSVDYKYIWGSFPNASELKEAMKIIRKIFPFRDLCKVGQSKPCFNAQLGLCPGVCSSLISKKDYGKTISELKTFFDGKKKYLISGLKKDMRQLAKRQEFEKATIVRKKIFALSHIQDLTLIKKEQKESINVFRIEAYDISHFGGKNIVGAMAVVENRQIKRSDYRLFKIRSLNDQNDVAALKEVVRRRMSHSDWPMPKLMVIDGGQIQKSSIEKELKLLGVYIPVASVVKDERHRPKEILGKQEIVSGRENDVLLANSESHRFAISYQKKLRSRFLR